MSIALGRPDVGVSLQPFEHFQRCPARDQKRSQRVAQIVDADGRNVCLHAHAFAEPLEVNDRLTRNIGVASRTYMGQSRCLIGKESGLRDTPVRTVAENQRLFVFLNRKLRGTYHLPQKKPSYSHAICAASAWLAKAPGRPVRPLPRHGRGQFTLPWLRQRIWIANRSRSDLTLPHCVLKPAPFRDKGLDTGDPAKSSGLRPTKNPSTFQRRQYGCARP